MPWSGSSSSSFESDREASREAASCFLESVSLCLVVWEPHTSGLSEELDERSLFNILLDVEGSSPLIWEARDCSLFADCTSSEGVLAGTAF